MDITRRSAPKIEAEKILRLLTLTVLNDSIPDDQLKSAVEWFSKTILQRKIRGLPHGLSTVAQAAVSRRSLRLLQFCLEAGGIDLATAQAIDHAAWSEGTAAALRAMEAGERSWDVVGIQWVLSTRDAARETIVLLLRRGGLEGLPEAVSEVIRLQHWELVDLIFSEACSLCPAGIAAVVESMLKAEQFDRARTMLDGSAGALARACGGEQAGEIAQLGLRCGAMECLGSIIAAEGLTVDVLLALLDFSLASTNDSGLRAVARAATMATPRGHRQTELIVRLVRARHRQLALQLCAELAIDLDAVHSCSPAQLAVELGHLDRLQHLWQESPDAVLATSLERAAPEAVLWFTRNTNRNYRRLLEYLASSPKLARRDDFVGCAMRLMGYSRGGEFLADLSRSAQLLIDAIAEGDFPTEPTSGNLIELVRRTAWGGELEVPADILMGRFARAPHCWGCGEALSSRSVFALCAECGHVVCRSGHCQTPHIRIRANGEYGPYYWIKPLPRDQRPKYSQEVDRSDPQNPKAIPLANGFCAEQLRRLQGTYGPLEAVLMMLLGWAVWEGNLAELKATLDEHFKKYKFAKEPWDFRGDEGGLWITGIPRTQAETLSRCLLPIRATARYVPWVAVLQEPAWCVTPRG